MRSVPGAEAGVESAFAIASFTPGAWNFSMSAQRGAPNANGAAMPRKPQNDAIFLIVVPLYTRCCMQYQVLGISLLAGVFSRTSRQLPTFTSPEVTPDRHIAFRILRPRRRRYGCPARTFSAWNPKGEMNKAENGVWELTIGPIDPGAYRYNFNVDGVAVMDPRDASLSESNGNAWSMVYVPGADFMETKDVPHGAVASVTYYSKAWASSGACTFTRRPAMRLGRRSTRSFICCTARAIADDSWTSVGRAGFIIDNLIAAKKAKPMVIVMPAGHTSPRPPRSLDFNDDFVKDFVEDIMPYAETHYRVLRDRQHRAIAGLSMGGAQTLNIAIPHADEFAYVGVYSSGIFGIVPSVVRRRRSIAPAGPSWEQQHLAELDNAAAKKGLKLFWFSTGKDDFVLNHHQGHVGVVSRSTATSRCFRKAPGLTPGPTGAST